MIYLSLAYFHKNTDHKRDCVEAALLWCCINLECSNWHVCSQKHFSIKNKGSRESLKKSPCELTVLAVTSEFTGVFYLSLFSLGFCFSNPCPFDSTCEELSVSFRCLCLPGSFYSISENVCIAGRRRQATALHFTKHNFLGPKNMTIIESFLTVLSLREGSLKCHEAKRRNPASE